MVWGMGMALYDVSSLNEAKLTAELMVFRCMDGAVGRLQMMTY